MCCAATAIPIAPVVVGLILGPLAEQQLRRALAISVGDPLVLFQSLIALTLLIALGLGAVRADAVQADHRPPRAGGRGRGLRAPSEPPSRAR